MPRKFLRRDSGRFSKLGKKRKKLQKWRGAKGRDNKIREKRFGYPKKPTVGYKKEKSKAGLISGKKPIIVYTINDVEKAKKTENTIIIIGKVGARKKLDLIKHAHALELEILNIGGKQ